MSNPNSIPFLQKGADSKVKPGWFFQWFTLSGEQDLNAEYCVVHRCSNGHCGTLGVNVHKIAAAGTVTPSVVCNLPGCTYHEWVKLDGWKEPENARRSH